MGGQLKYKIIAAVILMFISGVLFYLAYISTPEPGHISGGGNPVILFLFALVIIGVILIFLWNSLLHKIQFSIKGYIFMMTAIMTYGVIGIFYHLSFLNDYRETLMRAFSDNRSLGDHTIIDLSTSLIWTSANKVYFNLNTFIMFILSTILISLVINLIAKTWSGLNKKAQSH